jgi:hypothetical protein
VGEARRRRRLPPGADRLRPATALGPAPKAGQAETYASWRAAWRALGRPEADRDELELSDGQLRMRVRGYEREKAWAPRYVANELAATHQAADAQHRNAALRAAEAASATSDLECEALEREATESAALAATLDARTAELELADEARAQWLVHTAATRAAADRAADELAARRAGAENPGPEVTAEAWLAAHEAAMRAEDPHRAITDEADLVDDREFSREQTIEPSGDLVETAVEDVRDIAADEPPVADEDAVRVPSVVDETAESIRRAQRALAEIRTRDAADALREADEARAEQIVRWHDDDRAVEQQAVAEQDQGMDLGARW